MAIFQFLFFICVIFVRCELILAQLYHFCEGVNTSSSLFHVNVNLLLSSLSSNATTNKFYNATIGQNPPDKAYGLYLCRDDVTNEACKNCVEKASTDVIQRCPTQTEPTLWYDDCLLRYSNRSIFSTMQTSPAAYIWNTNNVSNPDQFDTKLNELMDGLVTKAADGSSTAKFATNDINVMNFQKIYGLVQCTPDLSGFDCNKCLRAAVGLIPGCCSGKPVAIVLQPSCYLRYDVSPFYASQPPPTSPLASPSPPPPPPPPSLSNRTKTNSKENPFPIIAIIVPLSIIAIVFLSTILVCYCLRKRRVKEKVDDDVEVTTSVDSLQFGFDTIEAATNNFSDANKLGKGGFGAVYKGRLSNGEEIAVKRLSRNSGQGEEQFKNEVFLMANLHHRNLVRLLGFCIKGEEKLLIYEFVPNTSLDHILFDPTKRAYLTWEMRYKIIEGIARGLLYLHEDSRRRIIHRDLKASNILLDGEMNPKISDFGMARLFVVDQTQGNSSRVFGTYGYMPPEYVIHGKFSVKSDVYSFGVLLLEMVSGQNINSFYQSEQAENLPSYVWRLWKEGSALELIDPTLKDSFSTSQVIRCIHIGLLCVQENAADRPTLASVVLMLSSYSVTLALPSRPAFFAHSRVVSDMPIISNSTPSTNDVSVTELHPRP